MEKIEIIQKFLLSLVPEAMDMEKDYEDFLFEQKFGWNAAREEMIKAIKESDKEKLIHELQ